MSSEHNYDRIKTAAAEMRLNALKLAFKAGNIGAHIGPALSIIDILAVLYTGILKLNPKNPLDETRDRFILSKGHGALGLYTALAEAELISHDELETFESEGGLFPGQPLFLPDKGIELASGSLGLGLSVAQGIAIALKKRRSESRVCVLMGDGECNEGSVWESALSCANFKLNNLIVIIDHNNMQSDGASKNILDMGDIAKKWDSFGFEVFQTPGHNIPNLYDTFEKVFKLDIQKPIAVIAHTIKGKGVSFMENNPQWHHNRITATEYQQAIEEIQNSNRGLQ